MTDEAKWIIDNRKLPEKGMFVDVGAFDGVEGSNTLPFEERGWTGICIEADPLNAWRCALNRKCKTVCAAIGDTDGVASFKVDLQDRGLSGLDRNPEKGQELFVGIERLERVIQMIMEPPPPGFVFDLLSIDTEGTEVEVYNSIGIYRPRLVIIEWNTLGKPPNEKEVRRTLEGNSYKKIWDNGLNMIFEDVL